MELHQTPQIFVNDPRTLRIEHKPHFSQYQLDFLFCFALRLERPFGVSKNHNVADRPRGLI
jgi:hypothetical protein